MITSPAPFYLHLRVLRRDQYRCQARNDRGIRCMTPGHLTRELDGSLVTVCDRHG